MFLARRPSRRDIDRFLADSHELPLSYSPSGLLRTAINDGKLDVQVVVIGHGEENFQRVRGIPS